MTPPMTELDRVESAARALARAEGRLHDAIREASASGATLRAIAERAGVSHTQVRQIAQEPSEGRQR